MNPSDETTTNNIHTKGNNTPKKETSDTTKKAEDNNKNTTKKVVALQVEKLHENLKQIKDSLTQLQKFEESDLAKQLRNYLPNLKDRLEKNENEATSDTNAFQEISKEVMKLKYQIPSLRKLSELDSSSTNLQTSNGSNVKSEIHGLVSPHKSKCFRSSSFYREIKEIFDGFDDKKKFFLSCFAALTENAVVKRRLLTYWGLGEVFLKESDSTTTPEKDVDKILEKFQEMGLIEPATKKRKLEIKSYKMDPLVRMAVNVLSEEYEFFQEKKEATSSSNKTKRAFLVKREEKCSEHGVPQSDQDEVVTLFNLNELSLDVESLQLSKMKKAKVVYLGRWQKSASHHILLKNTALFCWVLVWLVFVNMNGA